MVIAALTMLTQVNLKKLIGYSTMENMGFLLVGLGLGTPMAIFWMLFYILAHAFTKASLFFSAGISASPVRKRPNGTHKKRLQTPTLRSMEPNLGCSSHNRHATVRDFPPQNLTSYTIRSISPVLLLGLLTVFLFAAAAFGIFMIKLLSRKEEADLLG